MTIWQRIIRQPALIASAVRAILYSAVLFGLPLTDVQSAGVLLALESVLALITRAFVTPSSEVLVQRRPADPMPIAGDASMYETGSPVLVQVTPLPDEG